MKPGDLVALKKSKVPVVGIVLEIFDDLDKTEPWVRVLFTSRNNIFQWVKKSGLVILENKKQETKRGT